MASAKRHVFTSESVTEGHPDKVADQISDTVLDAVIAGDPDGRVACETLVTTGLVVVAGEITTEIYVDIPRLARARLHEIGYDRAKYGFDAETCGVLVSIHDQSADIALGVDCEGRCRCALARIGHGHRRQPGRGGSGGWRATHDQQSKHEGPTHRGRV